MIWNREVITNYEIMEEIMEDGGLELRKAYHRIRGGYKEREGERDYFLFINVVFVKKIGSERIWFLPWAIWIVCLF